MSKAYTLPPHLSDLQWAVERLVKEFGVDYTSVLLIDYDQDVKVKIAWGAEKGGMWYRVYKFLGYKRMDGLFLRDVRDPQGHLDKVIASIRAEEAANGEEMAW